MKALKFRLSGKTAFFKKPEVNTYLYFTYGNIHKVALLGIFGAILGYKGYGQMAKGDLYPEFYNKLRNLNIAIVPDSNNGGSFERKVQSFNNSVGYASKEQGGNLIVNQQWLENPAWDIYVALNCDEAELLKENMLNHRCVYIPYLGSNNHIADITNICVLDCNIVDNPEDESIESLYPSEMIEVDMDSEIETEIFRYAEYLPVGLCEYTNLYETHKLAFTNLFISDAMCDIYTDGEKNIVFI